jgi:Ca2+-binding RTX toxin-like protein
MSRTPYPCPRRNPVMGLLATAVCAGMAHSAAAQVTIEQLTHDPGGPADNSTANPVTTGGVTVFESNRNFEGRNPEFNSEIFVVVEGVGLGNRTTCTAGNSRIPSIATAGPATMAFTSTCDFVGTNPDGNAELFVLVQAAFKQITNTTGLGVSAVEISADGDEIGFLSDGDFRGQNGDHNVEVFWYSRSSDLFRQLTNTLTINNGGLSMDASGTWIAFPSRNNLTGGNPEQNTEIFLVDSETGAITQVTSTASDGSLSPSVTQQNGIPVVAFTSTANLTGENPERNQEIFLWSGGNFTQVTKTGSSFNELPSIDENGTRIAFSSNATLTGQNPDLSGEIYVYDATDESFLQVTDVAAAGTFPHGRPSMAPSGLVVTFVSSADLTGENADRGPEIFRAAVVESPCAPTDLVNVIAGTPGNDVLQGTPRRDYILGLAGDDRIVGGAGDDCVDGGDGNDRLFGGAHDDDIYDGPGNDVLVGNDGDDELNGEEGVDAFHGGPGTDRCQAEPGEQVVACEE